MLDFIIKFGKTEFLILLAMLPGIILGIIVYKKDIVEKEPLKLLTKLLFYGVLAAGVALFFELYLEKFFDMFNFGKFINIFIKSFFVIGLSEEVVKWFITYYVCFNNKEFNYVYDAIVYTVFVAIGFASIENIIAILGNNFDISLALKRGLITVPAHIFFAILSGYYLGEAKKYQKRKWFKKYRRSLVYSITLPILVHGLFDVLLFISSNVSLVLSIILIVYLYISSYFKILKRSKEKDKAIK